MPKTCFASSICPLLPFGREESIFAVDRVCLFGWLGGRRNIVPFDMAALPANLKACTTSKKKDALKEDAQVAFEAFKRTR